MQKIVINRWFGGFSLSREGIKEYDRLTGTTYKHDRLIARNDPALIEVVQHLGHLANGRWVTLKIIEIPDNVEWEIVDRGGVEWVAEKHQTWGRD